MHCLREAEGGSNGPAAGGGGRRQQSQAQEEVYRTFLACDLREAGEACLPAGVGDMEKKRVRGKMVVQVKLFCFFQRGDGFAFASNPPPRS